MVQFHGLRVCFTGRSHGTSQPTCHRMSQDGARSVLLQSRCGRLRVGCARLDIFVLFHVPGARIVAGRARDFPAELSKMVFRRSEHVLLVDSATLALLVVLRFGPVHCVQLVTLRCFVGVCGLVFRASWSRRASCVFVYQQIVFPLVSIFSFPQTQDSCYVSPRHSPMAMVTADSVRRCPADSSYPHVSLYSS